MRNIVLDDEAHKERREIDAHHWIDQIEPVGSRPIELTGEQHHNLIDDPVQGIGSNSGEEAHDECEDDHEHPLADVLHAPFVQALQHRWLSVYRCLAVHFLIIVTSPFSFSLMMAEGLWGLCS